MNRCPSCGFNPEETIAVVAPIQARWADIPDPPKRYTKSELLAIVDQHKRFARCLDNTKLYDYDEVRAWLDEFL